MKLFKKRMPKKTSKIGNTGKIMSVKKGKKNTTFAKPDMAIGALLEASHRGAFNMSLDTPDKRKRALKAATTPKRKPTKRSYKGKG